MPVTTVPNTATPNAGRVSWNTNDTGLQTEIDTEEAALVTHKASADHDGRYFTEAESDARFAALAHNHDATYVALTGAQTVAGVKTFSSLPIVEAAAPAYKLNFTGALEAAKIEASTNASINYLIFSIRNSGGSLTEAISIEEGAADGVPKVKVLNRDLYINNDKVATIADVDARINAGNVAFMGQTQSTSIAGAAVFTQNNDDDQIIMLPAGARIVRISAFATSGTTKTMDKAISVAASVTAIKIRVTPSASGTVPATFEILEASAGTVLVTETGMKGASGFFTVTIMVNA